MPKIEVTDAQRSLLMQCCETELASSKRGQKQSKSPEFAEVFKTREIALTELIAIVHKAK